MQVVWFKRDLRVHDHGALSQAMAGSVPKVLLYILEPDLWAQPDMSGRQFAFLAESLLALGQALARRGQRLRLCQGSAAAVLGALHARRPMTALWSHQETWNAWTYARDRDVLAWAKGAGVPWHEPVHNGVVRRLEDRDTWLPTWYQHIRAPRLPVPDFGAAAGDTAGALPDGPLPFEIPLAALENPQLCLPDLPADPCPGRQPGGRGAALSLLKSFWTERGVAYTRHMSSPLSAFDACSRLSPHIAFGTISVREAFQAAENAPLSGRNWQSTKRSFQSRLRWHCHFMQRLEDAPAMEHQDLHRAYTGLRGADAARLDAWAAGQTGYPLIDACMRALTATGWLNFRMRAMLMSFAAYHLLLDWRAPALHLARLFTDYEPGIHYSQVQMQSGTTGINAVRVYNPIKQSVDQDPDGVFIRRWIPELSGVPTALIHTPWLSDQRGAYPEPIVDEKTARRHALNNLFTVRRGPGHGAEAAKVVKAHGSRASQTNRFRPRPRPRSRNPRAAKALSRQSELAL